jgi:SAM-dependent methyltransferase
MLKYCWGKIKDLFKIPWFIKKIILSCGVDLYLHTDDRRVLETLIFPYFIERDEFSRILFVGSAWCTRGYNTMFARKTYATLDIDPTQKQYGAKRHITDSIENIDLYFKENELDVIICNGVFGWGLNDKASVEKTFQGCFACLREGGILVLGWNDVPKRRPFPLAECESLRSFNAYVFPPLSTSQYVTANPNRHTYNFYMKLGMKLHDNETEKKI